MRRTTHEFSKETRERTVRLVLDTEKQYESRWLAIKSVASRIGCAPQALSEWVKRSEFDRVKREGIPTETAEKLKALERENQALRQANMILRKASAHFAQGESGSQSDT